MKANMLSLFGWLFLAFAALIQITGWVAPEHFPKATSLAYALLMVAFFFKQRETVTLRRGIGVDPGRRRAERRELRGARRSGSGNL